MIRVVGKKVDEPKIYSVNCDECCAKLEFEESDTYVGAYGYHYVKCPECGGENFVEAMDDVILTECNIEFPKHFKKTDDNAMNIGNYKIQEWVRECIEKIKNSADSHFCMIESGNTVVIVLEWEDEYSVYVAKNVWESIVPKE